MRDHAQRVAGFETSPVLTNAESDDPVGDADQWVWLELYVRGEIQYFGGSAKAKA